MNWYKKSQIARNFEKYGPYTDENTSPVQALENFRKIYPELSDEEIIKGFRLKIKDKRF